MLADFDPATPFRWNVARREQLGALLQGRVASAPRGYHTELRGVCARVVALGGDADLVFVGRSPEHLFDYLSGAFAALKTPRPVTHLQVSTARLGDPKARREQTRSLSPHERAAFLAHLADRRIDPASLATNGRPVRFVDLVYTGRTFRRLLLILKELAAETGADWNGVERRIGFVGLTLRDKPSPKAHRWQQSARWRAIAGRIPVRNVACSWRFWNHIGNEAEKVTPTYDCTRWGREDAAAPVREEARLRALRRSAMIHARARSRDERLAFARVLAGQPEMAEPWLRALVLDLRATAGR